MGFWKNLFSSSESASVPQTADFEEDVAVGLGDPLSPTFRKPASGNARIFFSCDRDIDLYELEELCNAVGWSRRPLRKVKKAIQHSFLVVSMWEMRGSQRRLVGFARATSDHAFNATLWDVVVHPDYQGKGIGSQLLTYALGHPAIKNVPVIVTYTSELTEFMGRLSFEPRDGLLILQRRPMEYS